VAVQVEERLQHVKHLGHLRLGDTSVGDRAIADT
jgi:hypothetical protein